MKTERILLVALAFALALSLFLPRRTGQPSPATGEMAAVVALVERLEGVITVNDNELARLSEAWKSAQQTIALHDNAVRQQKTVIDSLLALQGQAADPPPPPDYSAQTVEEMAEALEQSQVRETWFLGRIDRLESITAAQAVIIDNQAATIVVQGDHIREMQRAHAEIMTQANRKAFAGVLVGTAAGVCTVVFSPAVGGAVAVAGVARLVFW